MTATLDRMADDADLPPVGYLAPDTITCAGELSLHLQAQRGVGWGRICRTVVVLPVDGFPVMCPFCGQRVM